VNNIVKAVAAWEKQYKFSGCRKISFLISFFSKSKFVAKCV